MSLKKVTRQGSSHLYEGPLDFMRGAAGATGQKVANGARAVGQGVANAAGAVKQQVGDVIDAGSAASLAGDISKAVTAFAKNYDSFIQAQGRGQQQAQPSPAPQPGAQGDAGAQPAGAEQAPQAGTPPSPEVQAKQADLASKRGMRNQPEAEPQPGDDQEPNQQSQPDDREELDQQARDQAIRDKNSGGVASPFQTTNKPKGRPGKYGNEWTFSSFMMATSGEQLDEGVWDFVKGAGSAAGGKIMDKLKKMGQSSHFADIINAGRTASREGDAASAKKAAQQSLNNLAALIKRAGPQGKTLLTTALNQIQPTPSPAKFSQMFKMVMDAAAKAP